MLMPSLGEARALIEGRVVSFHGVAVVARIEARPMMQSIV
jgi:hypothetical protein